MILSEKDMEVLYRLAAYNISIPQFLTARGEDAEFVIAVEELFDKILV